MKDPEHRFTWFGLNADGILIAILCLLAALDLNNPDQHDLAKVLGYVPPSFYLWTGCYAAGGVLLLIAFFVHRVSIEVFGRMFVVFGLGLEMYRSISILGLTGETGQTIAIFITLLVLFSVRIKALSPKIPAVIVIPGRSRAR